MKQLTIYVLLLLNQLFNYGLSQNYKGYAYCFNKSEEALRVIKHDTYCLLLTVSTGETGDVIYRSVGLNNNGTVRFNQTINNTVGYVVDRVAYDAVCSIGPNKSTFIKFSYWICDPNSFIRLRVPYCCLIDSIGNVVFKKEGYNVGGVVNDQFLFASINYNLVRINNLTGNATATLVTEPNDDFTAASVNFKKQIIYRTYYGKLALIDTLGVTISSVNITPTISAIKCHGKNYFLLEAKNNYLEERDSNLNVTGSFSVPPGFSISDFNIYNDTVYVSMNSSTQAIMKLFSTYSLTAISSVTFNIQNKTINAFVKDSLYRYFFSEKKAKKFYYNGATSGTYSTIGVNNAGFYSYKNIQNINFANDLSLRSIKTNSFLVSSTNLTEAYGIYSFTYQNSLVIRNNSIDTVKVFEINHPTYTYTYTGWPCKDYKSYFHKSSYTINIAPYDSVEIVMPFFEGIGKFPVTNSVMSVPICYYVTLPINQFESNEINSELCASVSIPVGTLEYQMNNFEFEIFPNPSNSYINILSQISFDSYIITDLCSKLVLNGNSKQIDIKGLQAGVYFICLNYGNSKVIKKFIKQ